MCTLFGSLRKILKDFVAIVFHFFMATSLVPRSFIVLEEGMHDANSVKISKVPMSRMERRKFHCS